MIWKEHCKFVNVERGSVIGGWIIKTMREFVKGEMV